MTVPKEPQYTFSFPDSLLSSISCEMSPQRQKCVDENAFQNLEDDKLAKNVDWSNKIIRNAIENHIGQIDHELCAAGEEDSFFVADLGAVYRAFVEWKRQLPFVQPFYAVKCNTDMTVIKVLAQLGANFDCASKKEIEAILLIGVAPERIVYANPCKTTSYIRYAQQVGVNLTTVDNMQELSKLHKYHPKCRILIRIATDDESAQCRLSQKFGCTVPAAVNELLPEAKRLGLVVCGVSFHVGSGAKDFRAIYKAIEESRGIFDKAINEYGYRDSMRVLDIGGGFEGNTFDKSAAVVRLALADHFPLEFCAENLIEIIAEPGRLLVANAFTLVAHVIARRDLPGPHGPDDVEAMIYVNDGVYGNLNCILFDHQLPEPRVLAPSSSVPETRRFSVWGPTCDGLDCIAPSFLFSHNVLIGDWLYFSHVGAYTSSATTSFNGFNGSSNVIHVTSEDLSRFEL